MIKSEWCEGEVEERSGYADRYVESMCCGNAVYTRYNVKTAVLADIHRLQTFDVSTDTILRFQFLQNLNMMNRTFLCIFFL